MTSTRYVIELDFEDQSKINGMSEWQLMNKIKGALRTLNHKKSCMPTKLRSSHVVPISGSLSAAFTMVEEIKKETEESARNQVEGHEDDYRHCRNHCYD